MPTVPVIPFSDTARFSPKEEKKEPATSSRKPFQPRPAAESFVIETNTSVSSNPAKGTTTQSPPTALTEAQTAVRAAPQEQSEDFTVPIQAVTVSATRPRVSHRALWVLSIFLMLGIVCGACLLRAGDTRLVQLLSELTAGSLEKQQNPVPLELFFGALSSDLLYLIVYFVLGFCAIAAPISLLLPFVKGLGLGLSVAYFYQTYGLEAVGYCGIILGIPAVISCMALLWAGRESLWLSKRFLTSAKQKQEDSAHLQMTGGITMRKVKKYCLKFLLFVGIMIVSALVNTGLHVLFAESFIPSAG